MPRPTPNSATGSAPRPSIQLTTDAVVASYIHAISDRHHREEQAAEESPGQVRREYRTRGRGLKAVVLAPA